MPDDFRQSFPKTIPALRQGPLEHWVSRIAINTCINQIQAERARPEFREADLSDEEVAVINNLAATSEELGPDRSLPRAIWSNAFAALKPAGVS